MLEAKFGTIPYFSLNLGDDPLLNRLRIAFVIVWVFWNRLKSDISKEDPNKIMYAFLPFLTSRILSWLENIQQRVDEDGGSELYLCPIR